MWGAAWVCSKKIGVTGDDIREPCIHVFMIRVFQHLRNADKMSSIGNIGPIKSGLNCQKACGLEAKF